MPRVSLATLAKKNEARLQARYDQLLHLWSGLGRRDLLENFHDHCHPNWRVSMNCDWRALSYFLSHGEPYNVYRHIRKAGEPVDLPADEQLPGESPINWTYLESAKKLSPEWAARRRKFNEYAHREEEFTYGAYYLQGPGLERYGKQLVVLKRAFLKASQEVSYLMADSLQWYVAPETATTEAAILEEALHADLATFETVSKLLCLKKAEELHTLGHDACLETVTQEGYIEAQIPDPIGFEAIDRVRVRALAQEELDFYTDFITQPKIGKIEEYDTQQKKNAYYYMLFRKGFPEKGVPVEEF